MSEVDEGPTPVVAGASRLRVTVDRADNPKCSIAVGDYFEIHDTRLHLPQGEAFCPHAISAALLVAGLRQVDLPADHWLIRKPWVCCPDATENVILRLDAIEEEDNRVSGETIPGETA